MGAQHEHHGHHRHGHAHGHGDDHTHLFDTPEAAEHAEVEGEVLLPITEQAVTLVVQECERRGQEVRRIVDIGCGPGVGTCVLAERFPTATVIAADGSEAMLARAAAQARAHGLTDRVRTRRLELPGDLDELDRADVVWASMVLHHVGDEVDALRRIRPAIEPHGLLALVERSEFLHVVMSDVNLGRPGFWSRVEAAREEWFQQMRAGLPDSKESADYGKMLAAAGFDLLLDEVLALDVAAPLDDRAARFAREHLVRTRSSLESSARVDPADLDVLDQLINGWDRGGPGRNDAALHGSRRLLVASPRLDS